MKLNTCTHRPWREEKEGKVYLKITHFPVPSGASYEGVPVDGESMWVEIVAGNDNKGTGILRNTPAFCDVVKFGDMVQYHKGSKYDKPQYAGRVHTLLENQK